MELDDTDVGLASQVAAQEKRIGEIEKGLTEAERTIAIRRLERNNAGTISHTFNKAQFFEAFRDYKLYTCALMIILTGAPSEAIGTFGTIVINGFGFSHYDCLALTYTIGAITALAIVTVGYATRKLYNIRHFAIFVCALISIMGIMTCWFGPRNDRGLLFTTIFLMAILAAAGALAVSLASNIAGHSGTLVGVCVGNVIGPEIFGASSGPEYHARFVGSCIRLWLVAVIAVITYFLLRRDNAKRNRATGGRLVPHAIDEDLSDMQN